MGWAEGGSLAGIFLLHTSLIYSLVLPGEAGPWLPTFTVVAQSHSSLRGVASGSPGSAVFSDRGSLSKLLEPE